MTLRWGARGSAPGLASGRIVGLQLYRGATRAKKSKNLVASGLGLR